MNINPLSQEEIFALPSFQQTVDFIKQQEGFRGMPYMCPGGVKTIGYGHSMNGTNDIPSITEEEATETLEADLLGCYQTMFRLVSVPLTDGQETALVSLIFNVGVNAFTSSTLRMKINKGDFEGAAQEFDKWCHVNGEVLKGLQRRRMEEKKDSWISKPL